LPDRGFRERGMTQAWLRQCLAVQFDPGMHVRRRIAKSSDPQLDLRLQAAPPQQPIHRQALAQASGFNDAMLAYGFRQFGKAMRPLERVRTVRICQASMAGGG
jgi:hypothetical protein